MLGLYPTWFEPGVGSGWIIGFIATIHVLFSHASVGGAVLFAWLANFAVRRDKPAYLAFIRRYITTDLMRICSWIRLPELM